MRRRHALGVRNRLSGALVALAIVSALSATSGCSSDKSVSTDELEKQVSAALEKQAGSDPGDVSCPDELPAKVGEKTRCTLTRGSDEVPVEVAVTAVDGSDVDFEIAPTLLRSTLEDEISTQLEQQVGQAPDDISCPDDLIGTIGETMRCTLSAGADELGVAVEVTGVDGTDVNFSIEVDDQSQDAS